MRNLLFGCALLFAALPLSHAETPKSPAQHKTGKDKSSSVPSKAADGASGKEPEKTAYSFELPGADGKGIPLSAYKGKVVMLVNLGRNSSYNDQLSGLAKLQERYKDLVIIGIPSNDFGAAEPGTEAEIQKAYKTDANVPFTITARAVLTGEQKLPLYEYLTKGKDAPAGGEVHWNFTKFVINRDGKVISRLEPDVQPDSPEMLSTLDDIVAPGEERPGRKRPEERPAKLSNGNSKAGKSPIRISSGTSSLFVPELS